MNPLPLRGAAARGAEAAKSNAATVAPEPSTTSNNTKQPHSQDLQRALSEVKAQSQFLLYLVERVEEAVGQLSADDDPAHSAFLCKILGMYSSQLETKHQGLGEKIAEACQELYVTVREYDLA